VVSHVMSQRCEWEALNKECIVVDCTSSECVLQPPEALCVLKEVKDRTLFIIVPEFD